MKITCTSKSPMSEIMAGLLGGANVTLRSGNRDIEVRSVLESGRPTAVTMEASNVNSERRITLPVVIVGLHAKGIATVTFTVDNDGKNFEAPIGGIEIIIE